MTVKELMKTQIATCRPQTNLAEASALMWDYNCGILPVLSESGELTGVVTDRDICIALGTRNARPSDLCVRDVVHNHVLACKASDDIHTAMQTMRAGKVRRLPVLSDDSLVEGVISMDDAVLHAVPSNERSSSAISYNDALTTLQGIYARDREIDSRPAAA